MSNEQQQSIQHLQASHDTTGTVWYPRPDLTKSEVSELQNDRQTPEHWCTFPVSIV